MAVLVGRGPLTFDEIRSVAREDAPVEIESEALAAMAERRLAVEAMAAGDRPVYGVSTGFGSLASTFVEPARRRELQSYLIRSHAAGMGDTVEREVVRAMMLCRLHTLCSGVSGVRPSTALAYAGLLNAGVTPLVPEFGSLGCSGDLAPLAHVALALTGEGEVEVGGRRLAAAAALADAGLEPVVLAEKEGLSLINGTDGMLGMLVLAVIDAEGLLRAGDVVAAMSVQALRGTDRVFAADIQALRPHVGQAASARNLIRAMADSPLVASHRDDTSQVQDAYSLRCVPQVHGAARDTVAHARAVALVELASSVDNPSILPDGRLESNGNFHGAPLGYVLDFCAIAAADVASMAERRTDRLLDPSRSQGLGAFLALEPGVDSGLMIAQYTQAAMVAEMKRLAVPASVDSLPTSAMQEDHVSLGWHAARKLRRSLDLWRKVLAVELLAAARALAQRPEAPSAVAAALTSALGIDRPGHDQWMAPQLAGAEALLASGRLEEIARGALGPLE